MNVGKLVHLKMIWKNSGKATFELKQGNSSGVVKFGCFSSNFKHMRSWKLWQKTNATADVKPGPFEDIFLNNTWFMGETQGMAMKGIDFYPNKTWAINGTNATAVKGTNATNKTTGNWTIDSLNGNQLKLLLTFNGSANVSRVEYTMQPNSTFSMKETKSVLKNAGENTVEDFIAKKDSMLWTGP